jgi:hypothetical protein
MVAAVSSARWRVRVRRSSGTATDLGRHGGRRHPSFRSSDAATVRAYCDPRQTGWRQPTLARERPASTRRAPPRHRRAKSSKPPSTVDSSVRPFDRPSVRPSVGNRLQGRESTADSIPRLSDAHAGARPGTRRKTRASVMPTSDGCGRRAPGLRGRDEPRAQRCRVSSQRSCVSASSTGGPDVCRRGMRAPGSR